VRQGRGDVITAIGATTVANLYDMKRP